MDNQKLSNYMTTEHGVNLLPTDMQAIERIVNAKNNKTMRKTTNEAKTEKVEFYRLLNEGYNQKQAAQTIGINEKTASSWAKQRKRNLTDLLTIKKNIIKRMATETAIQNTPTAEIHNLATALAVIERQINAAEKG